MNTKNKFTFLITLLCALAIPASPVTAKETNNITATRIVYAHGSHQYSNFFSIKPDGSSI